MRSRRGWLAFFVFPGLALILFNQEEAITQEQLSGNRYIEGEVLVKFHPEADTTELIRRIGVKKLRTFADSGWELVRLPSGLSVPAAMQSFRSSLKVSAVQPNFVYHTQTEANDPRFSDLYGLNKIQAPSAWDVTTGSANVVVAVIDLGIDYSHEDLNANMWRNPGESGTDLQGRNKSSNGIDDDGNGYTDDVFGIDTINHDSDPRDDSGHGTHVAGIIGAVGNNGLGVVGVNWNVRLMALKTHDAAGNGTSASVVEAFRYATAMRLRGVNVRVTNSSWGGAPEAPVFDQALKDAIDAAGNVGILNVCAAGNRNANNDSSPFYPATYDSPSIISVTASDQSDDKVGFSSYGVSTVDLAAPGIAIFSTLPGAYGSLSGTSMATPHVSGAAALLSAYNPNLTPSQLKATILNNVDVAPQWNGLTVTGGRLNVSSALRSIVTTNQIDSVNFFVRQHYLDFLGREPDVEGQAFWTNEIAMCGTDQACIRRRRIDVSAAFFIETEFQQTGSFVIRLYRASLGRRPDYAEFAADRAMVLDGPNLEQLQQAFVNQWITRPSFTQVFPFTMTPAEYVNKLFDMAQLIPFSIERQQLIDGMTNNGKTRADVLRAVIDLQAFKSREFNAAFVLMQYFGYLRRDPDVAGYFFWLDILNNREPNNYRSMVCAFLTSAEYQLRFANVISRTNAECGQ